AGCRRRAGTLAVAAPIEDENRKAVFCESGADRASLGDVAGISVKENHGRLAGVKEPAVKTHAVARLELDFFRLHRKLRRVPGALRKFRRIEHRRPSNELRVQNENENEDRCGDESAMHSTPKAAPSPNRVHRAPMPGRRRSRRRPGPPYM